MKVFEPTSQQAVFWILPLTIALTIWASLHVTDSSLIAPMAFVLGSSLVLLATLQFVQTIFLVYLSAILIGYMVQGRGFAYLGVAPLYVGEIALCLGIAALMTSRARWRIGFLEVAILGFMLLGVLRTLPYVRSEGTLALRDAAAWYYAAFALILARLLDSRRIHRVLELFAAIVPVLLLSVLAAGLVFPLFVTNLPHFPGSPLPIISVMKAGDRAVVLTALAAFVLVGLYTHPRPSVRFPMVLFWMAWGTSALMVVAISRGSMLSIGTGVSLALLSGRSIERARFLALVTVATLGLLLVNPSLELGTSSRDLSIEQIQTNFSSIFSSEGDAGVQGTKNWRLSFWTDIFNQTVRGPLFWTGHGFGVNLVTEYGYVVTEASSLRSPHNSLMTVLARMGTPGAVLWLVIQFGFVIGMLHTRRVAVVADLAYWASVITWLLAIWLAALVNSFFDVYLEGPHGAIPFWCVVGTGIAVMRHVKSVATSNQVETPKGTAYANTPSPQQVPSARGRGLSL